MPAPQQQPSQPPYPPTDSTRWKALPTRDPSFSNKFIYAVLTTKIYCRPNCPSRLARRANIVFFDNAAQAEGSGFRACLRCKPRDEKGAGDLRGEVVGRACERIRAAEKGEVFGLEQLAREAGWSRSYFCRSFKEVTGVTPRAYRRLVFGEMNGGLSAGDECLLSTCVEKVDTPELESVILEGEEEVFEFGAWIAEDMLVQDFVIDGDCFT